MLRLTMVDHYLLFKTWLVRHRRQVLADMLELRGQY